MNDLLKRSKAITAWLVIIVMLAGMLPGFTSRGEETEDTPEADTIYHKVSFFDADGTPIRTTYVEDGETVTEPATPELPAGMNSFLGWFEAGVSIKPDQAFHFDQGIFNNTNFYAGYSEQYMIQFENLYGKVLYSVLAEPGTRIEKPEQLVVFSDDDGMAFTGEWSVLAGQTFDFNLPVDRNYRVFPVFDKLYIVQFETKGQPVEPQAVAYDGYVTPVNDPVRAGYEFQYWSLNPDADPDDAQQSYKFDFDNTQVQQNLMIYAIWKPQEVNYRVVYWLEKANIPIGEIEAVTDVSQNERYLQVGDKVIDPAQFEFAAMKTKKALAGQTVSGSNETGIVKTDAELQKKLLQNTDGMNTSGIAGNPYSGYYTASTAELAGDGTTIINVYYTRNIYTMQFLLEAQPGYISNMKVFEYQNGDYAQIQMGKDKVYQEIKVKIGLDASTMFPSVFFRDSNGEMTQRFHNGLGPGEAAGTIFRGWGPWATGSIREVTGAHLFAGRSASEYISGSKTARYRMLWNTGQKKTIHYTYVEALNQEFAAANAADQPAADLDPAGSNQVPYLRVAALRDSGFKIKLTDLPVFELRHTALPYWAQIGDRQLTVGLDGFSYYAASTTNTTNCYQWEHNPQDGDYYQLLNGGNRTDSARYYFFSRNEYQLSFVIKNQVIPHGKVKFEMPIAGNIPALETMGSYLNEDEVFLGWYLDADYMNEYVVSDQSIMPAHDLTLFARIEKKPIEVTFLDRSEGKAVKTQQIAANFAVENPQLYEVGSGYDNYGTFVGWYWVLGGRAVPYNFETVLSQDTEIFAVWRTDGFTLTYDLDLGEGEVPEDYNEYESGARARVSRETGFTNGDLKFAGWIYEDQKGRQQIYYPGMIITIYEDVTLVARYVNASSSVLLTYRDNIDSEAMRSYPRVYEKRDTVTVADNIQLGFVNETKEFLGWSVSPHAMKPDAGRKAGDTFVIDKDMVLYAVWEDAGYYVTYHQNVDDTDTVNEVTGRFEKNQLISLPDADDFGFEKDGYEFAGWSTDRYAEAPASSSNAQPPIASGSNATVVMKASGSNARVNIASVSNLTLEADEPDDGSVWSVGSRRQVKGETDYYAIWRKIDDGGGETKPEVQKWTLTYHQNGGSQLRKSFTYKDSANVTIKTASGLAFARDGYQFLGWSVDADATIPDSDYLSGSNLKMMQSLDLYAVWEKTENGGQEQAQQWTLTYYRNTSGQDQAHTARTYAENSEVRISSGGQLGFSRSGYTFAGWSLNRQAGQPDHDMAAGSRFVITGNISLYAIWNKNSSGGGGGGNETTPPTPSPTTEVPSSEQPTTADPLLPTLPVETEPGGSVVIDIPPGNITITDDNGDVIFEGYIPDGKIPLAMAPGSYQLVILGDDGVTTTYTLEIPDTDTPLGAMPKTGDSSLSAFWIGGIQMVALAGIGMVVYIRRKKQAQ